MWVDSGYKCRPIQRKPQLDQRSTDGSIDGGGSSVFCSGETVATSADDLGGNVNSIIDRQMDRSMEEEVAFSAVGRQWLRVSTNSKETSTRSTIDRWIDRWRRK